MSAPVALHELIGRGEPDAVAIAAPGRAPMTHEGLRRQVSQTADRLAQLGYGPADRIAIVLPNGPDMATAFVSIGAVLATAPLNPAYTADEFRFYLNDIGAAALVAAADEEGPAVAVAGELGIAVLRLEAEDEAGAFTLAGEAVADARPAQFGGSDATALLLHTSGTTSRPKLVPLSQANICASAHNICECLELTPRDRCLNVMPLFHIHGLMAAVLSSLAAGASVYCTPGFNALKFFGWLQGSGATWYTAVPTMHQTILDRAGRNEEIINGLTLRFIRSSSASLAPQVMKRLEKMLSAPVIESYGMTEAAHQMTSTPLPPLMRKPGSVGRPAGPDIALMDEDGHILGSAATGEVVIRGDNVMTAYENNEKANADAFTAGWFRTGDQGRFDSEGYLEITGRLKEIINRGGEKISPREVDEVLMDHAAVDQAVTFAVPHEKLGEDVAAVVVLRAGGRADERSLRDHAAEHLAPFKVPRTILIVDEIPKGPTGKLKRIGLAATLGLEGTGSQ